MQTAGSGYKSVPSVTISGGGGAGATGTAQMVLGAIDTAAGIGSGYTSIPTVTITGGGAQRQATGEAVVDFNPNNATFGKVIAVRITDQGIGYQWTDGSTVPAGQAPLTITFSGGGGTTASTTGSLAVRSIRVAGGSGYATAPTITVAAPSSGGSTATAVGLLGALNFRIGNPSLPELENIRAASVVIGGNSRGDVYASSAASVTLNSDFGFDYGTYSYAPRTAVFAADGVVALGLSQVPPSPSPIPATSSIQVPNFSVIAGGAVNLGQYGQASANAQIRNGAVSALTVDYAGEGYTQAPTVTLISADGNGSGATATATINASGQVTAITIINPGSDYTTAPLVQLGGPIIGATATPVMTVGTVAVTNGGSGYVSDFIVNVVPVPGTGGTGGQGLARVRNGRVVSVEFDAARGLSPGSGYTEQPTINFGAGGAIGTAYLSIQSYQITGAGTGYHQAPIITITPQPGTGGFGASATASLNANGSVSSLTSLSAGSFYTRPPVVSLTGVPTAPNHRADLISAEMTGAGNSFRFARSSGSITLADLKPLGGATGIATSLAGLGGVFLAAPTITIPTMPSQLVSPANTSPYIQNGIGEWVVNPDWNPYYEVPSAIRTAGTVYLGLGRPGATSSNPDGANLISVAVVPQGNSSPVPSGSVVKSSIEAGQSVVMTADQIQIGYSGGATDPGVLPVPIVKAGSRVTLQPRTTSTPTPVTIGAVTANPKSGFGFIPSELANIAASILQIGNRSAGAINIQTLMTLDTSRLTSALSLISGSTIGDSGGSSGISYEGGLRLSSVGAISFTGTGNNFGTVAADSGGNNDITLSSRAFSIGTVDGVEGINLEQSSPRNFRVTLQPNQADTAITLGSPSQGAWGFSEAMLEDLIRAGTLQIGNRNDGPPNSIPSSGPITINAALDLRNTASTVVLESGAGVANSNPGGTGVAVEKLAILAGGAVSMGGADNATTGNTDTVNQVQQFAANLSGPGALNFASLPYSVALPALSVTTVDGLAGINTSAGNGNVTLTADDIVIDTTILQTILTGSGQITLQPLSRSTPISLNDPSNSLSLSALEMQRLNTSSTVVIGRVNGTGTISLGGSGTLNLASKGYSLTLRGGASDLIFNGGLILAAGKTFTLNLWDGSASAGGNVRMGDSFVGTGVSIANGTIFIQSAGSVGTLSRPLSSLVAKLSGSTPGVRDQLNLRNEGALAVTGPVTAGGDVRLSSSAGQFSNTSDGTIESSRATVTLEGNTMALRGQVTAAEGITVQPYDPARSMGVFGGSGLFQITLGDFGFLNTSSVTIGRADSKGPVDVGPNLAIGKSLTIQSPLLENGQSFTVAGLDTAFSEANLTLNAGGGVFTANGNISAGDAATRNGTVSIIAQAITINSGFVVTGNGPGGDAPGISLANGAGGDVYLNTTAGAGATDLLIGGDTLGRLSSTAPVSFGRLTSPDGTPSQTKVYVGNITVGAGDFPFGGLNLLAGTPTDNLPGGEVVLRGNILSQSKPVYIDGPLVLPGSRAITMNHGGGVGAKLSILNGIRGQSSPFGQDLTITMGTGANTLTLAGGQTTDRMGTLDIIAPVGASLVLGSSTLGRGLNLGFTESFTLPITATLAGGSTRLFVEGSQNTLTVQGLSGSQNLTLQSEGTLAVIGNIQVADVTLLANQFNLGSQVTAITAQSGNATVGSGTMSEPFTVGTDGDITAQQLQLVQANAGEVRLGNPQGTGGVVLRGPINLSGSGTINYAVLGTSGGLQFTGSSPVLSLPSAGKLRLDLGSGSVATSGGTDLSSPGGELVIDRAGQVTIRTAIGTVRQTPGLANLTGLNLVNAGSLTLAGAFNTGMGNILVQTLSGDLTLALGEVAGIPNKMTGALVQLGAARNFINLSGSDPFRVSQRALIYSAGQRYDMPYNFAGLNGFGVAFGRGFGSTIGSGNMLIYSSYAQVGLDEGVVYNEMFAGNSVTSLLALSPSLFWSVNGQMIPKTRPGGYIDYMLYPQRVEPATMTLPQPVLSRLEQKLGRPPTVAEIAADEADRRRNRMMRTGGLVERNSFDADVEPQVEAKKQIRADRADAEPAVQAIPQAHAAPASEIPTARVVVPDESAPQASKSKDQNQEVKGPALRRGINRAVALRAEPVDASKILAEEREKAEVNLAAPVAAGK